MKYDLSILIPARNEMFLARTVEDILANKRDRTEIIVGLDGQWAEPGLPDHPDVTVVYFPKSLGQRGVTNQLCRLSKAKYVMKLDAHCALDEGFDIKMMAAMQEDYTMIPMMYNLHAFDWVCTCGNRIYQGPTPEKCEKCGSKMEREVIWKPRMNRKSTFYRFDKTLHFQYWGSFEVRPEAQGNVAPTMSAQGSCFMLTREKYWELDICDEKHGSWGQQGVEVAMKTWLSGGKLMVNKNTWYAHMFRTQGGDFGFPYPLSGKDVKKAREYSEWLWKEGNWKPAKHDLNWLLDKFYPVPDWHDENKSKKVVNQASEKGIVYYTDNQLNLKIAHAVQKQLVKAGIPIVSASLKPMSFGQNVHIRLKRGYLTMAKQILAGLEASQAKIIFLCEHDVLYDPSHFDFIPDKKDVYYYNTNVWRVRASDGHALYTEGLQQLSGLCAYRETLIRHFEKRIKLMEEKQRNLELAEDDEFWGKSSFSDIKIEQEFNKFIRAMGFEPGTHGRPERIDDLKAENYFSKYPNIDIRHDKNLTVSRWKKEEFRNERYTKGWTETYISQIPDCHFSKHDLFV